MSRTYRSILVPLDGSAVAEQALAVGASLARRTGATLHLVSVQEPIPAAVTAEVGQYGMELERESRAELNRYLSDTIETTRRAAPITLHGELLEGHPADAIAQYVTDHGIDLVVMTTHARKGLARWWLGSVGDRLLRRVSIPILLLHPSELPQPTHFRRILVALDGEIEDPVLDAATGLGGLEENAEYLLFRVAEPPVPLLTPLAASPSQMGQPHLARAMEDAAAEYLDRVQRRLHAAGHKASWRVVRSRDIPDQVVELAEETGADCIVLGTHGARGLERFLIGSVADKVVRSTALPVLVSPLAHR
jgi:nucleotide-binding universal stress UspA family protein